jgi:hypothetical protein
MVEVSDAFHAGPAPQFFHGVEKSFPQYGKFARVFSMPWNTLPDFFHAMEKSFPQHGKLYGGGGEYGATTR